MAYTKKVDKLTFYKGRLYQKDETITFAVEDEDVARTFYGAIQEPVPSTPDDLPNRAPAKAPRPAGKSVNNNSVTKKGPEQVQVVGADGQPVTPIVAEAPLGDGQPNPEPQAT